MHYAECSYFHVTDAKNKLNDYLNSMHGCCRINVMPCGLWINKNRWSQSNTNREERAKNNKTRTMLSLKLVINISNENLFCVAFLDIFETLISDF
jgi:hypothetical protein